MTPTSADASAGPSAGTRTTPSWLDGRLAARVPGTLAPDGHCVWMSVHRVVPDITTPRLEESRDFYVGLLGFAVAMDMGWVVTLVSPVNRTAQVILMTRDASAPVEPQISIEVADVDSDHAQAVGRGDDVVYPLTDEPWGVRRFFVRDPSGVVINVLGHRPAEGVEN